MNTVQARNKTPYFTFVPNMAPMQKMPSARPAIVKPRGIQMSGFLNTPPVRTSRMPGKGFYDEGVAYKNSYASAIEPMDLDEWGQEDNWQENVAYEQDIHSTDNHFLVPKPREQSLHPKSVRGPPDPRQMMSRGGCHWMMEKPPPLRQSVLNVDSSHGLSFKPDPKRRKLPTQPPMKSDASAKKLFPKWNTLVGSQSAAEDKELNFPRILTVTVEKLQKWPKMLAGTKVLFELYGILEGTSEGQYAAAKAITLKGEGMKDRLICTFYAIDRALPPLEKGHWQRCVVLLRSSGDCQCLDIRSATPNELKNLDRRVTSSSKEKALLLKTLVK